MSDLAKKILELPPHARSLIEKIVTAAKTANGDTFEAKHWLMTKELYVISI